MSSIGTSSFVTAPSYTKSSFFTAASVQDQNDELLEKLGTVNKLLELTEEVGNSTVHKLDEQEGQISRINDKVEDIGEGLDSAEGIIRRMKLFRSPFGLTGRAKKYAYVFRDRHGANAEWSGPLRIRERTFLIPVSRILKQNCNCILSCLSRYIENGFVHCSGARYTFIEIRCT